MAKNINWHLCSLIFITVLNLICALSLDLYADESYYWLYSEFLDWGYFDHPPAVGLIIKLGFSILDNELGVRLLFVAATTLSYHFMHTLTRPSDERLFWLISLSFFPLHLMGFMALPDILVFLCCILFMHAYKRYLQQQNTLNVLLISLTIAGMIYSKYHGLIFVFFVVISNLKLLRKPSFYSIVLITLALLTPHILWQIDHEYASLKYHFIERSSSFKFSNIVNYILGFLFYNGPLVFVLLIAGIVKSKVRNDFERSMQFIMYGFFIFFLFSSLKGRVEANWTFFVIVPAIYLGMNTKIVGLKITKQLSIISIVLILLFRLYLLFPFGNLEGNRAMEFHGHQEFANKVKSVSEGLPIITARYQIAGILSFYLRDHITAVNVSSRKNQFDFWSFADSLENQSYVEINNNVTKNQRPADSIDHYFLGKHYVTFKDSLQLLRYPKFDIKDYKLSENNLTIRFLIRSQNLIESIRPVTIDYELYTDREKPKTIREFLPCDLINDQKMIEKNFSLEHTTRPHKIRILLRNPDGLDWTTQTIHLE